MSIHPTFQPILDAFNASAATPFETIAVSLVRRFVAERDDEIDRPDAGCELCTLGTTPKRLDTGLCAHHAAEAFLRRYDGRRA